MFFANPFLFLQIRSIFANSFYFCKPIIPSYFCKSLLPNSHTFPQGKKIKARTREIGTQTSPKSRPELPKSNPKHANQARTLDVDHGTPESGTELQDYFVVMHSTI